MGDPGGAPGVTGGAPLLWVLMGLLVGLLLIELGLLLGWGNQKELQESQRAPHWCGCWCGL